MSEPEAGSEAVAETDGDSAKSKRGRNVMLETVVVALVTSVLATVGQKLVVGSASLPVSVALTVVMELVYFKFLAPKRS